MSNTFLIITTILIGIIFLVGLYERIFNMPGWFADPPTSFSLIREHTPKAQKIHLPLQILFIITFVIALVLNWDVIPIRTYMFLSLTFFLLIIITTAAYFAKEIIAFPKMREDTPVDSSLIKRAKTWEKWTSIRNVFQLISFIFLLIACSYLN